MKIQIVGTGIVGEATACLAQRLGHEEIFGYDIKPRESKYYRNMLAKDADIVFICVNETAVEDAIGSLIDREISGLYVVRSSTKPGTLEYLSQKYGIHICHHPEYLRENSYLQDSINPKVIMFGLCCIEHEQILDNFYGNALGGVKRIKTVPKYTELAKISLNVYRANLITFWNNINDICLALDMDTRKLCDIVRSEGRINSEGCNFFGKPFEGRCLPKDFSQLIEICHEIKIDSSFWDNVSRYNDNLAE